MVAFQCDYRKKAEIKTAIRAIIEIGDSTWEMPDEMFEFLMCSKVWHCTPSQFAEESAYKAELHWLIYNEIKKANSKK